MATLFQSLICALLATGLWTVVGWPIAARIVPRALVLSIAPILGWAVHSALALPLFSFLGMSQTSVIAVNVTAAIAALALLRKGAPSSGDDTPSYLPITAIGAGALVALAIMMALMPKLSADGVALAAPIFDHSKIALIDEMTRAGVPPANPFIGGASGMARLSYYYLWHFSAAELAVMTGFGGWNADAGLTWFTAFASLTAMMGFATWLSGRRAAAFFVVVLAATGSARPVIGWIIGDQTADDIFGKASGFAGWFFQTSWAPQHAASALCALLAIFLLARLAARPYWLTAIILALVIAASFESSTWVGGIVLPLAALGGFFLLLRTIPVDRRWRFAAMAVAAGAFAVTVASPFLYDQYLATAARAMGSPIALAPYPALGSAFSEAWVGLLDLPAYWLLFLAVELPAIYPFGAAMLWTLAKDKALAPDRRAALPALLALALISLTVTWLLASTIGDNNDLGWRAALPAILLLTIFAAAGLARYLPQLFIHWKFLAVAAVAIGLPKGALLIHDNIAAPTQQSSTLFTQSAEMWEAVRRQSRPLDRVANNPLFMQDMTDWPVNISWALLADRRSCYAGRELALPFAPLPKDQRLAVDAQFIQLFAGDMAAGAAEQLMARYGCDVVVVTAQDGLWRSDPFAASAAYRLVENSPAAWRIYKAAEGLSR